MPVDVAELVERLRAGIGFVPPALFAVILLAGPTVGWLLYRFVVQPRYQRMISGGSDLSAMWVCTRCRSVNDLRVDRCYRCDARVDEQELQVIDSNPIGVPRLTAVGPGLDLGGSPRPARRRPVTPSVATTLGQPIGDADDLGDPTLHGAATVEERAERRRRRASGSSVPVGPGRPVVARPRRARASGEGPSPDDSAA